MAGLCECGRIEVAKGLCRACYNKIWKRKYYHSTRQDKPRPKLTRPKIAIKSACTILKNHHESMKDDPEHLTTEFIKKLIKVDCKEV